jgi:hypothetical protein
VVPFHVVTYKINPQKDVPEEQKDFSLQREVITFAGFVSDHDPSLLFVMTYAAEKNISYIKVLKIEKKEHERSYSLYEDEEKKVLIENLKNNLLAQGIQNSIPKYDAVKVEIQSD